MEYFIDSTKKVETLQIKCDDCESCIADSDSYNTYEEYKLALEACQTCTDCKKHGNCQTTIWHGPVGSLFMDFLSLDFCNLNNQILKIVDSHFKNFALPQEVHNNFEWGDKLINEINEFLVKQHFLFNYCSIGDKVVLDLYEFNFREEIYKSPKEVQRYLASFKKIDITNADTFPNYMKQANFWEYMCLQAILNECITNKKFYNMVSSSNSPLGYFGFGYRAYSKTSRINELKFDSMFARSASPDNIIEKINVANKNKLYKEPSINEYEIEDTLDFVMSSFSFMLDLGMPFRRCANCGKYFIPENKSDTKYCNRISPQYPRLTCKEAAKYIKQLEREKGNYTERLRKSIYNTLRNRLNSKKALQNGMISKQYQIDLNNFLQQAAQWKSDVKVGAKSEKQYVKWLLSFKKRK